MTQLFLHIGVHKTGSTSIQGALQDRRELLLRQGLHVVRTGCSTDGNHAELASALLENPVGAPSQGLKVRPWFEALDEIASCGVPAALISSEVFSVLEPIGVLLLRDLLAQANVQVHVVVFVREQLDILRSNYVELLKQGVMECDFDTHLALCSLEFNPIHALSRFDFQRMLTPWLEAFGTGHVTVLPYAPGRDSVRQFFRAIKRPFPRGRDAAQRLNVSPDARVVSALILVNQMLANCEGLSQARRTQIAYTAYRRALDDQTTSGAALPCSPRWESAVRQHYRSSNQWLQETVGVHIGHKPPRAAKSTSAMTLSPDEMQRWMSFVVDHVRYSLELVLPAPPPAPEPVHAPPNPEPEAVAPPAEPLHPETAHAKLAPPSSETESTPTEPVMPTEEARASRPWVYALEHPHVRQRIYDRYLGGLDPMSFARQRLGTQPARWALEIACGERGMALLMRNAGLADRIDAVDPSAAAIEMARRRASEAGVARVDYFVADLEAPTLHRRRYDFVYCSDALQRVNNLEGLLEAVAAAMKPDGLFFANEYIGPSRLQYTDQHLACMNRLLESLPTTHRSDRLRQGLPKPPIERLPIDLATQMGTATRSQDIVTAMSQWFDVELLPMGMTLAFEVLQGIVHCFDPDSASDNALLDLLLAADGMCTEQGWLAPSYACLVARPKATAKTRRRMAQPEATPSTEPA